MKEIIITTTATVVNEETWFATVPDDFDITDEAAVAMLFTDGEHDMDLESEDPQMTLERDVESVELTGA